MILPIGPESNSLFERIANLEKEVSDLKNQIVVDTILPVENDDEFYCPVCSSCGTTDCCGETRCKFLKSHELEIHENNEFLKGEWDRHEKIIKGFRDTEIPVCAAYVQKSNGTLVVTGRRHHNCLYLLKQAGQDHREYEDGFLTNFGRFVDRTEAKVLYVNAGYDSHDPGGFRGDILFSEDLY